VPLQVRDLTIPVLEDLPPCSKVLVRIDVNSPIDPETGEILDTTRFEAHATTLRELAERSAVVAMSHQGRPGEPDFRPLRRHAEVLAKVTGLHVEYVDDVIGPEAIRRIRSLPRGTVLLLDNSRIVSEDFIEAPAEVHARGIMVSRLAPLFECYVNDAFATSHRSQASIVGFPLVLPSAAGRVMERELRALARVFEESLRPKVFVLGGSKLRDMVSVIDHLVSAGEADWILTTGLTALLFLQAMGADIGEASHVIEAKGGLQLLERARRIIAAAKGRLLVPRDFLAETGDGVEVVPAESIRGSPKDIGPETLREYSSVITRARLVVMKGPAGVVEDPRFRGGTRGLVEAALQSGAFTLFGGGHFNVVISELPRELRARVGHISTAGGALVYMLSGRRLPGLEALARSALIRGGFRA
jgi:phosphoglycerate kinase